MIIALISIIKIFVINFFKLIFFYNIFITFFDNFNNIFVLIIDDTMNDIKGPNGSFVYNVISACDLDAFDRLIDPNCRQIEINDRLIEVEAIVEVYDQKNSMENLENDFDDTLYEMTKLDQEGNESNLTRMLTKMHITKVHHL